jgi:hypothetical protein
MTLLLGYWLKVVLLLLLAGLFYRLWLDRVALGRVKRAYLLLALVLAHLIPVFPVREVPATAPQPRLAAALPAAAPAGPSVPVVAPVRVERAGGGVYTGWYVLGLGYLVGLFFASRRFIRSVRSLVGQIRRGRRRRYGRAWLVELPGTVAPHTFGRWIFYGTQNRPAPAILAHEYAHVVQRHTLDRLFVALLRTLCWFNPLLPAYERAIIFNHELLADRAVLRGGFAPRGYQYHLLAILARHAGSVRLASGADFHFTKKRLQMMLLPAATPAQATFKLSLAVAFGALLFWGFGRTTVGPEDPARSRITVATPTAAPLSAFSIQERTLRRPTADQLAVWQNTAAYGVWIDGQRVRNAALENYDAADFSFYLVRRNTGGEDYEVKLTTNATFARNRYVPNWQRASCQWEPAATENDC